MNEINGKKYELYKLEKGHTYLFFSVILFYFLFCAEKKNQAELQANWQSPDIHM